MQRCDDSEPADLVYKFCCKRLVGSLHRTREPRRNLNDADSIFHQLMQVILVAVTVDGFPRERRAEWHVLRKATRAKISCRRCSRVATVLGDRHDRAPNLEGSSWRDFSVAKTLPFRH